MSIALALPVTPDFIHRKITRMEVKPEFVGKDVTFFANYQSQRAWTPSNLEAERPKFDISRISAVRIEFGYENGEDAAAAVQEWTDHKMPVVITAREYDREPMYGQGNDSTSMFGLPPEAAYRFGTSEFGGFRFCGTDRLMKRITKFYRTAKLVNVVDSALSILSLPILHRNAR